MIEEAVGVGKAAAAPPLLRLSGLTKKFGAAAALHPVDLEIAVGSFTAILGPSGCGKSTLLRLIAGFIEPTAGRVEIAGADVTRIGPEKRPTNMVFQGYGLFPHMTVAENVGFGLAIAKEPRSEITRRVDEALRLVRLESFADRSIEALSGGQQQRVALARALIMRPLILLLDEPLAALDLKLRQAMQEELRRIHKEIGGTFIFVTHDQGEAFALADRLIVMNEGRVEQIGHPEDVYAHPASLFVAHFVGDANILRGERRAGRARLELGGSVEAPGPDGAVTFVLRPEAIRISNVAGSADQMDAVVEEVVFLGNDARLTLLLAGGHRLTARTGDPGRFANLRSAMHISVGWPSAALSEIGTAP